MENYKREQTDCREILRQVVDVFRSLGQPCFIEENGTIVIDSICLSSLPNDLLLKFKTCQNKLRSCLQKNEKYSSRRYPAWFVRTECLDEDDEEGEEKSVKQITLKELISLAKLRFESSPWVSVSTIRSAFEDVVSLLEIHEESEEPLHVLLLGSPGVGKSLILSFFDHPSAPLFVGATTTPRTLVEYLADTNPTLIRFDEIDKTDKRVVDALLNAMSKGRLIFMSKQGRFEIPLKAPVLAAANEFERKVSESWRALQDRFIVVSMKQPDIEELRRIVTSNIDDEELAEKILASRLSLRTIHKYIVMWRKSVDRIKKKKIILNDLTVKTQLFS